MLVHFRRREGERESRGDFNFRGVEVEEGETPPAAVGRTAEGGREREREERTLERREKSARAADFTGTERHRARGRASETDDRGQRTPSAEQLVHQRSSICSLAPPPALDFLTVLALCRVSLPSL